MSKKISGAEFSLSKIFSSDFDYEIPAYQRPYAWTTDQVSELFDDLHDFYIREQEENYFLGSIVLIKDEGSPHAEVIDGQQRLTSLTILLSVITSKLSGEDRSDFAKYIREPGRPSQGIIPKPRLALRERDRVFFENHIQNIRFEELFSHDLGQLDNESQRNILLNTKLLLAKVDASFNGNVQEIVQFGSFIVQRCYLVAVSTPNRQSAFRIFSVLNSRGLDLLPTDIIKSDIIGVIDEQHQNNITEKWEYLEVQTGRYEFAELFGHIRMIYAKAKAKRTLLEEFREHVITSVPNSLKLIDEVIEPLAEAFLIAKKCKYVSTESANEINILLHWLNRIDNSDWLPPAILFLSKFYQHPKYVNEFFVKLERLAACLHITSKNINFRIDRYCKVISEIQEISIPGTKINSLELNNQEKEELITVIDGNVYWLSARKRNYLILRLDSFLSDAAAIYEPSILTIEHVLPQTVEVGSEWESIWPNAEKRDDWTHRLANLVPLTQRRNSSAQNFDFARKKRAYFGGREGISSYVLTSQVLATEVWDEQELAKRQDLLLDALKSGWQL